MAITLARRPKKQAVDIAALAEDVEVCRLALRRPCEEFREMVRQQAGNHYAEDGAKEKVPVNLISLYMSIMGRNLIPKAPRGLFSTFDRSQEAVVSAEEAWMNKQVVKMRLDRTLQRVVNNALFSIGILKVSIATPAEAAQLAWNLTAGEPYADDIDLDDFVFDMHARNFDEVAFIGHRYRVPLDAVRDSSLYNAKARDRLVASNDEAYTTQGSERTNMIGRTYYAAGPEKFEPRVDLWEIYIPRKKLVLTLVDGFSSEDDLLRQHEWLGPDCGPYHILGYEWVSGNCMPKGPVQNLMDMHLFLNQTMRKLMRQANRQKENTFVMGGASEDGKRVMEGNDGEVLRVDNPDKIKSMVTGGGPNNANTIFFRECWELASELAGNIKMLGGLGPQSKTATQDKMLMQTSSGQVMSMQQDTSLFAESVFQSLHWFYHYHPELTMQVRHQIAGMPDMAITRRVTPAQRRQVKHDELDIRIDIYSMQGQTPQSKMQGIMEVVKVIQPFMQLAQQQGIMLDLNALVAKFGKFLDLPEILEILTIQEPLDQAQGGQQPGMGQPAETTRNYVRRSLGDDSQQSQSADLMNQLAKGSGQNGEMPLNQNGAA